MTRRLTDDDCWDAIARYADGVLPFADFERLWNEHAELRAYWAELFEEEVSPDDVAAYAAAFAAAWEGITRH